MSGAATIDPDRRPGRPVRALVALGSNLGDRQALIDGAFAALGRLPETALVAASCVHETEPVGPPGQGPYLNAVAELRTGLSPRELLERLLAIERNAGRDRGAEVRFGPRTLDLDLLCWGPAVPGGDRIDAAGLSVPHPRMHERTFVLVPLSEVAPDVAASARSVGIHFPRNH